MSQHDFDIANQTASNARSDLNDALQALASLSSGSTAPSTTYANMLWYDTGNNILKMRAEADDAWINIGYLDQSADAFRILDNTQVVNTSGTQTGLIGDQSTATWEAGTSTTESLVSPAKVKAAVEALVPDADEPIGVGQSWQTVSLSSGSARQNTTGRPIQMAVTVRAFGTGNPNEQQGNASFVQVSSNGSNWITVGRTDSRTEDTDYNTVTAVIPDNHYYRYNGLATYVAELR